MRSNTTIRRMINAGTVIMILFLYNSTCDNPIERSGPIYEGSAKWAYQIAEPEINAFASDARLYEILGAEIWANGRLPGNTGTWSFVTWSSSLHKQLQVTVSHDGTITKRITDEPAPPATGSGTWIPTGWANSIEIFSAIPSAEKTKSYATLAVFNVANYPQSPDNAVWAINFQGGKNPLVSWNADYIGTQYD